MYIGRCDVVFAWPQIQRIADEGVKFRQLYQCNEYPSILIIDPRTGVCMCVCAPQELHTYIPEL